MDFGGTAPMVVVHEDGSRLDWPKSLDAQVIADLDRWRHYLELSLHIPKGQLGAIRWSDGELQLVLRHVPEPEREHTKREALETDGASLGERL
jgi:hypothetical protein